MLYKYFIVQRVASTAITITLYQNGFSNLVPNLRLSFVSIKALIYYHCLHNKPVVIVPIQIMHVYWVEHNESI